LEWEAISDTYEKNSLEGGIVKNLLAQRLGLAPERTNMKWGGGHLGGEESLGSEKRSSYNALGGGKKKKRGRSKKILKKSWSTLPKKVATEEQIGNKNVEW